MGWLTAEGVEKLEGAEDDDWSGPAMLMNDDVVVMVVELVVEVVEIMSASLKRF